VRIVTVAGTRPELIKLAPLVPVLSSRFDHRYLFTGQHYSPLMVQQLFGEHEVMTPDISLATRSSDLDTLRAALLRELRNEDPDLVLVYGDTNSTLAAAQATREIGAILIHIEAGVRSFDKTMVEERNRIEVDRLANLRLAPTPLSQWFLTHLEGFKHDGCPAVGNLVVDAWMRFGETDQPVGLPDGLTLPTDYGLLTLHRPDTVDRPQRLQGLLDELGTLPMDVLFPVHPRTREQIKSLSIPSNIQMLRPLPYPSFCFLLRNSSVVLTDSGGVQEEAATARRPCVTLRPNTDRAESLLLGMNRLYDPGCRGHLAAAVEQAIAQTSTCPDAPVATMQCPYGDGHTAERITVLLEGLKGHKASFDIPAAQGLAGLMELENAVEFVEKQPRRLRVVG
jgi:UDP-N-acetylglucosamine 2-epimerase (non-hydrolysing)